MRLTWLLLMDMVVSSCGLSTLTPLFRFGVLGDVQYADIDDGPNFAKTRTRRYRQSLEILREASAAWGKSGVDFCVELGDLVDSKATSGERWRQLADVKAAMGTHEWHVPVGNHDLSVFARPELHDALLHRAPGPDALYYDWRPANGFRCCVLDAYAISVAGATGGPDGMVEASRLLSSHNPNIDAHAPAKPSAQLPAGWLHGMDNEDDHRWVPYNGAFGQPQLTWFRRLLADVEKAKEKLIVFCHAPIYKPASKPNNLAWDFDDLLAALDDHPAALKLFFAGHDHDGGFAVRSEAEHHFTLAAPIECHPGQVAYGTVDVYPDHATFDWVGKVPDSSMAPWPDLLYFR